MNIVFTDAYTTNPGDLSLDDFNNLGSIKVYDRTSPDELYDRAKDADILVVNKVPLGREMIDRLPKLKFVALMSTGYNVVDYKYLGTKGIPVSNIPSYSTEGVSQLVMSFILEFASNVGKYTSSVKNGDWVRSKDFCYYVGANFELSSKTLGIYGLGSIGRAVAKRADAFGMTVKAYTPRIHGNEPEYVKLCSVDELLSTSDFLTFHCPLTPETDKMVDREFLSRCKRNAYIINTSRGQIINESDLAEFLNSGYLSGAAFDVLSCEPPKADNPLLSAKNTLFTPHIAWGSFETRKRLLSILFGNIKAYLDGEPTNVVNM